MVINSKLVVGLSNRGVNIPYNTGRHDDGTTYPYIRLVNNPSAAANIPEVAEHPFLISFLEKVNQPGQTFETVRILQGFIEGESTVHFVEVGLIFQDRSLFAAYHNCMMLAGNLLQEMSSNNDFDPDDPVYFYIERCTLKEEAAQGWVVDLSLAGTGDSKESASANLALKLNHLLRVLL
ncbi:hypothetical protein [Vreelandella sp.]|uniref:hypothetical protein n=1 Tax=Vreelandella sp. TaxID=3137778 RepID=UPI003BAAC945